MKKYDHVRNFVDLSLESIELAEAKTGITAAQRCRHAGLASAYADAFNRVIENASNQAVASLEPHVIGKNE